MYSRVETITPKIAAEYLKHNVTDGLRRNRRVTKNAISRYAEDMRNGRWQLTPQGIAFFENGDLADGQHRLLAVILANVPVQMNVTYDVPNDSTLFDRGVARSLPDVLHMSGKDGEAYGKNGVATTNFLFLLDGHRNASEGTKKVFIEDNAEMLATAISLSMKGTDSKKTVCRKAPCYAAAFCALYCGINSESLARFFAVVNTGFADEDIEKPAIVLRNYLIQEYNSHDNEFAFVMATNAIKDYANGVPRTKRYKTNTSPAFFGWTKKMIDTYK